MEKMEMIEQGINLAMEMSKLEDKVMNYLNEAGDGAGTLLILTAHQSFNKKIGDYVHNKVKTVLRDDPELVQRIREDKVIPEKELNEMVEEANKTGEPAADDVTFQPIK